MRRTVMPAVVLCGLLPLAIAPRWGASGHEIVGAVAAATLPGEMPAFFRAAGAQLAYLNAEPDRWRDSAERSHDPALNGRFVPDHFIDLELIPEAHRASIFRAPSRHAFADSLRARGLDPAQVGYAPFAMLELTQRMRAGLRRWRAATDTAQRRWIEQRILDDAGILGHYVADAANPAHTTIHFNGWAGDNPRGYATDRAFHARFESEFVDARVRAGGVRPRVTDTPRVFGDIRAAIVGYVTASNALVIRLYELDREQRFGADNRAPAHRAFAEERLAAGAQMLRDLWWTAWVTSAGADATAKNP